MFNEINKKIYIYITNVLFILFYEDRSEILYIYISAAWKFVNPLEFSIFLPKYDPKHHQIFI